MILVYKVIMDLKFELIERNIQPTLSIRTTASVEDLPTVLGNAYQKIMNYLSEIGEYPSDAPFVAYYNMDMEHLDIEIGFPVKNQLPTRNYIESSELPSGTYVQCIHIGPYSELKATYNSLMKWMGENQHEWSGVAYEFYLNDPSEVIEEKLETRIMILLA
jgi:effector-binding domain-containing protein